MPNIGARELTAFAIAAYEAAGHRRSTRAPSQRIRWAPTSLHYSHGAVLLPTYVDRIDRGSMVPGARPEVLNESPTTLAVNGRWGFGPVISEWTMERLIAKACEAH